MGGMESFMYRRDNELIDVAEAFARKRDGIDDTTKVFLIKLRQLIFTPLENRGFNNININYNQNFLHEFIKKYQSILNNEIDRYHKLKADDIIQKVVTLFWFRFKVQEPIAKYTWFNYRDKIDPSRMEGIWDDDDTDNIVVDIFHFPLIADKSTNQIYTPLNSFINIKDIIIQFTSY
ncbi:hypothetical protein RhiirA4_538457 [Rhizophagus irregularis]|uniref:Uncharacterized protein n=1 Tax=Rhizophagus irregularis TaxID=588596 RepID=A0A2I1FZY2_9GLOM|nr:hypothetical protein RhiirA4_538457 [Rhizophagus irregularis]